MKFSRLLVLVGAATTAAVSITAFPSSADALTWTLNNVIFNSTLVPNSTGGAVATGSFDYDASINTYSNVNILLSNGASTIYTSQNFTTSDVNTSAVNTNADQIVLCVTSNCTTGSRFIRLVFQGSLTDVPGAPIDLTTSTRYGIFPFNSNFRALAASSSGNISTPTPVPFDIPGGATIPAVGGLLALGLMRKARKSLASNTRISKPISEVVS